MVEANTSHYKALLREIRYVIDTKYYFCQIKPERNLDGPWELHGYSNMGYAGYHDTYKTVTGYIVLIDEVVIDWCSRS